MPALVPALCFDNFQVTGQQRSGGKKVTASLLLPACGSLCVPVCLWYLAQLGALLLRVCCTQLLLVVLLHRCDITQHGTHVTGGTSESVTSCTTVWLNNTFGVFEAGLARL